MQREYKTKIFSENLMNKAQKMCFILHTSHIGDGTTFTQEQVDSFVTAAVEKSVKVAIEKERAEQSTKTVSALQKMQDELESLKKEKEDLQKSLDENSNFSLEEIREKLKSQKTELENTKTSYSEQVKTLTAKLNIFHELVNTETEKWDKEIKDLIPDETHDPVSRYEAMVKFRSLQEKLSNKHVEGDNGKGKSDDKDKDKKEIEKAITSVMNGYAIPTKK